MTKNIAYAKAQNFSRNDVKKDALSQVGEVGPDKQRDGNFHKTDIVAQWRIQNGLG